MKPPATFDEPCGNWAAATAKPSAQVDAQGSSKVDLNEFYEKAQSMCRYISDDGKIARYLGVPEWWVRRVRIYTPTRVKLGPRHHVEPLSDREMASCDARFRRATASATAKLASAIARSRLRVGSGA